MYIKFLGLSHMVDVWETEIDLCPKKNVNHCVGQGLRFQFAVSPRPKELVLETIPGGFMTRRQENVRSSPSQDAGGTITGS